MESRGGSRHTDPQILRDKVSTIVGYELGSVTRLRGGSKKGVYRAHRADGCSVIAYVWDVSENYWEVALDEPEPFTDASGQSLFLSAQAALRARGVHTLDIVARGSGVIVVEDLRGGSLEVAMVNDPNGAAVAGLRDMLDTLHAERVPLLGKVGSPLVSPASCEQIAYRRAVRHLAEARARRPELPAELHNALDSALARVGSRTEHALIHGELGPEHVLLDRSGCPVLIDIEGLMYFDLEWEHAFMSFRFGTSYRDLRPPGLDEERLRFYELCLRLSLIAGPLRLLDGDFPDRAAMLDIVDANSKAAMAFLD